jgi:hypothetical protein
MCANRNRARPTPSPAGHRACEGRPRTHPLRDRARKDGRPPQRPPTCCTPRASAALTGDLPTRPVAGHTAAGRALHRVSVAEAATSAGSVPPAGRARFQACTYPQVVEQPVEDPPSGASARRETYTRPVPAFKTLPTLFHRSERELPSNGENVSRRGQPAARGRMPPRSPVGVGTRIRSEKWEIDRALRGGLDRRLVGSA